MSKWTHVIGAMSLKCEDFIECRIADSPLEKDTIHREMLNNDRKLHELLEELTGQWEHWWAFFSSAEDFIKPCEEYFPSSLEFKPRYGSGKQMPCTSSGNLFYNVERIGEKDSYRNALITFWGDLENYEDEDVTNEMIPFFQNLILRYKAAGISAPFMSIQICTSLPLDKQKTRLLSMNWNSESILVTEI